MNYSKQRRMLAKEFIPPLELPMLIKLKMTREDIEKAICNSRRFCAIARTIYRQLDAPIGRVRVTTAGASIAKDGYRYFYRVPERACHLVKRFDAGLPVDPINFSLNFSERRKIQRVPDARKAQVNAARRAATALLVAAGERPKTYSNSRYGI